MIKLADISVSKKEANTFERFDLDSLTWEAVPDGLYNATLVTMYPWKEYTGDVNVRLTDEKGWYLKHDDGKFITELQKDVKYAIADLVYRINGGEYDGYAVKGTLSTHPNFLRTTKDFLINGKLFDVTLDEVFKHVGKVNVGINTRQRTDKFVDKNTGLEKTNTYSIVSWTSPAPKVDKPIGTETDTEDIGI